MECREIEELMAAYSLNALPPEEMAPVEAHLSLCPRCASIATEYSQVAATLAEGVRQLTPPQHLRRRVLQRVGALETKHARGSRARLRWRPVLLAVAGTLGVLVLMTLVGMNWLLYNWSVQLRSQLSNLQAENDSLKAELASLEAQGDELQFVVRNQQAVTYMLANPKVTAVPLQSSGMAPNAQGVLLVDLEAKVGALLVNGLKPLPAERSYQVWWFTPEGQRSSGGVFSVDEWGWHTVPIRPEEPLTAYKTIIITEEPAQGSPVPTSPGVLVGDIKLEKTPGE